MELKRAWSILGSDKDRDRYLDLRSQIYAIESLDLDKIDPYMVASGTLYTFFTGSIKNEVVYQPDLSIGSEHYDKIDMFTREIYGRVLNFGPCPVDVKSEFSKFKLHITSNL